MSFRPKIIAISVTAFLAVVGGGYALMPDENDGAANVRETVSSAQAPASRDVVDSSSRQSGDGADLQGAPAAVATRPSTESQPVGQAPAKLTKRQLTPPPATEEEKLQKAAEQESNF
jgi:hypothetical protein